MTMPLQQDQITAMPARDTLALEGFLPYRLARAAEIVSRQFAALYRERHGMTRPEWRTLATIGQFNRITATEIGAHSSMHKTKVSRAIRSLEARKWITRQTDETDRRIEHIELTCDGRRHYSDLVLLARSYEEKLVSQLGCGNAAQLETGIAAIEAEL
ncbi:MarR family transcriptional regulator [Hoeflea sp. YIM 152468]|uniref:MarR family winged helix-turn-helix transcriptional regulator n=1 Tax=Hoeflea sp. YIM 152468 TaxID=3031759 RepID=UPI0023D99D07|nr:MarR family transcriptional regulator [Hoeflea sp. YIM 152468]MDF1607793.1 MarR family transcriptional regulator [Hoeflea sp. YIM 152468]